MRARKLVFLILLTTFSFSVKAQFPLDVHLLPQQGTYYCWAACTEMIVDYYHRQNAAIPLYTQCEIATNWLESRRIITNPTATPFTIAECCPTPCPNTVNSYCNKTIADLSILKKVFLGINYISDISILLTEERFKKQIDVWKQPLVASIDNPTSGYVCNASHVVIAKGYITEAGILKVIVNDPSSSIGICNAEIRKISFSLPLGTVDRICSYLWISKPIATPGIMRINTNFDSSSLAQKSKFDTLPQNPNQYKWDGELSKPFSIEEFGNFFLNESYVVVPVKYIDFQKLLKTQVQSLEQIEYNKIKVVELVYKNSKPHTVNRYQLSNQKWLSTITFQQNEEPNLIYSLNGKKVDINNQNSDWKKRLNKAYKNSNFNIPLEEDSYEKVVVPPLYYEFYRFKAADGKIYYKSLGNYKDLGVKNATGFDNELIYNEEELIKTLKNKAIEYDKMLKNN